jgi:processive 1,2-diacylglycerol beta-glucosyltransferase
MYSMAERLLAIECRPQVVAVTGRNAGQLQKLHELEDRHPESLRALGFCDEMDRWLDAADVNVTKAGGLTCSETLAKQVPMVIYRPTPGQEDRNSQALTTVGAALRARTLDHVADAVDRILSRPSLARSMQEACTFLGRPEAAAEIAGHVLRDTAPRHTGEVRVRPGDLRSPTS